MILWILISCAKLSAVAVVDVWCVALILFSFDCCFYYFRLDAAPTSKPMCSMLSFACNLFLEIEKKENESRTKQTHTAQHTADIIYEFVSRAA